MPVLSIIIPVYNAEKYIKKCLDSILSQKITKWECLLVDDGSKDSSGAFCDEYAKKDSRFRVIHKENGGVSSARNVGLDEAKGEYICFIDSDDYFEPGYFEALSKNCQGDIILTGFKRRGAKQDEIVYPFEGLYDISDISKFWNFDYKVFSLWFCWGKLYRREIIVDNDIRFNSSMIYHEDTLFLFTYLKHAKSFYVINNTNLVHVCEDNRVIKYVMNYDVAVNHITHLDNAFTFFNLSGIADKKIRGSYCRRFLLNFLVYLFSLQNKNDFNHQLHELLFRKELLYNYLTLIKNPGKISSRLLRFVFECDGKIKYMLYIMIKNPLFFMRQEIRKRIICKNY